MIFFEVAMQSSVISSNKIKAVSKKKGKTTDKLSVSKFLKVFFCFVLLSLSRFLVFSPVTLLS